jgi:uncharacterized membrane protein
MSRLDERPIVDSSAERHALVRSRVFVGGMVAGVLVFMAVAGFFPRLDGADGFVLPAAIIGAVSPIIGYRSYQLQRDRLTRDAGTARRLEVFFRANLIAMAITETAALFGLVVHALTGSMLTLLGVLMHVLLAGALWPTVEKLESFGVGAGPGTNP